MAYTVPFVNAKEHYRRYRAEFEEAITKTLANGDLVMRQQLSDFEEHFAAFCGTKYAVGVNSGYHALHLSMLALGIGPGDEVVTVAHTFVATISAIVHCGATPVLIDVTDDYNMNVDALEASITPRTKAILPVHLNGRMAEMTRIMEIARRRNLLVVEDAAQAIGATIDGSRAGSIGNAGCFSFYPFKILGGFGDGGAVTTNDPEVARAVRLLRYNGEDRETGEYHYHGYTALLDNIQAAVLDVKLKHLPAWINHRRTVAERYRRGLTGIRDLRLAPADDAHHRDIFQNYVIRTTRRDPLREHLRSSGVETLLHWPKPVWEHAALKLGTHRLPNTEAICREVISLPMSAETSDQDVDLTVAAIRKFFGVSSFHQSWFRGVFALVVAAAVAGQIYALFFPLATVRAAGKQVYEIKEFAAGAAVGQTFRAPTDGLQSATVEFSADRPASLVVRYRLMGWATAKMDDHWATIMESTETLTLRQGRSRHTFRFKTIADSYHHVYQFQLQQVEARSTDGQASATPIVAIAASTDDALEEGNLILDKAQIVDRDLLFEAQGADSRFDDFRMRIGPQLPKALRQPAVQWILGLMLLAVYNWALAVFAYHTVIGVREDAV